MAAAKKDAKPEPTVFVATQSGSADVNGEVITFVKGQTRVRAGHAILKQLGQFFEPADQHLAYEETAAELAPAPVR